MTEYTPQESVNLLKIINQEVEDFKSKDIQVVPGLTFNQYQTLEQIFFYYNSKFKSGDVDDEGDRKYFYNIVKNPCKVFSKAIDFDTKNIRLLTAGGGDPTKTWFMERDLKFWLRDKQFGRTLNRIFHDLPIYGSVVIKLIKGTPYFVDLRNFVVTQTADDLDQANFITEMHLYSVPEFRRVAKEMGWSKEKVNETIKEFRKTPDVSHIKIFERYGECPKLEDSGETTYTYKRVFIADVGQDEYDQREQLVAEKAGVILSEEEWDGHPYWEFHAEKIPGRWLGVGVVETLFEPQIRQNELCNLHTKTSYWAALRIFQTRDPAVARNLFTDIRNGEILNVDSEITQVDMSDRNLGFFADEGQKWMRNRDELTFSWDVVQGERLPAGTTLGAAQIATTQTLSYFEQIQETLAMDVKEMLYEVLETFEDENSAEHTLRLVGQDLDAYVEMVTNELVLKEMIRQAINAGEGGAFPTNTDRDTAKVAISESIKQGREKILTVPKDFYKDLKYDLDIDITGESVDTRVRYATKFALLQAITADPTMTTDPVKKRFLSSMAEDGGVNPIDLFGPDTKELADVVPQVPSRAGGGVSAPALGQRLEGQVSSTI